MMGAGQRRKGPGNPLHLNRGEPTQETTKNTRCVAGELDKKGGGKEKSRRPTENRAALGVQKGI